MTHRSGYEQAAHLYDLFDRKANVEFFAHYALTAGEILDIGAGTGRIAIPLAERGVRVHCVEPSPAMRGEFERKLAQRPELRERITLVAGDARSFDLRRPFQYKGKRSGTLQYKGKSDCRTVGSGTFQCKGKQRGTFPAAFLSGAFDHFLDDEERLASMRNVARHLDPGGTLVFDVFLGLMRDAPLSPAGSMQVGDQEYRRFVGTKVLADQTQEVHLVFEAYRSGRLLERIEERSLVGIVSREHLHYLLIQTGLKVKQEFGDYDFCPFREGDALLIVEAEKGGLRG